MEGYRPSMTHRTFELSRIPAPDLSVHMFIRLNEHDRVLGRSRNRSFRMHPDMTCLSTTGFVYFVEKFVFSRMYPLRLVV
jgi:hypothetical protein